MCSQQLAENRDAPNQSYFDVYGRSGQQQHHDDHDVLLHVRDDDHEQAQEAALIADFEADRLSRVIFTALTDSDDPTDPDEHHGDDAEKALGISPGDASAFAG
jgi:hypothetical protein